MSRRWEHGSTRRWRRTRELVLTRDNHHCRLRIEKVCTVRATQVHHTQPREIVGDDPRYLVAACAPCNQSVGDPSTADPEPRPAQWW